MDKSDKRTTTGGALDIRPEHVTQNISDAELKGRPDEADPEADAMPPLEGVREGLKQKSDSQVSKSDLEDADIRNSAPGTREQD